MLPTGYRVSAATICPSASEARCITPSGFSPPKGWGMTTGWNPSRPSIRAWRCAESMNGPVQITTVGIPRFSRVIASCTLHEVQEPQSAMAVTTKSHRVARVSMTLSAAGLE